MGSPSIRLMQSHDLPEVLQNEQAAYEIPWSRGVFEESLVGRNVCRVLCLGSVVAGHAVSTQIVDEFHLLNLCVAPRFSGQGWGRYLLNALIRDATDSGCAVFFLEVRASNSVAISLYRSEGFNEVGIRPNYYPAASGREDAVLMTLQLAF